MIDRRWKFSHVLSTAYEIAKNLNEDELAKHLWNVFKTVEGTNRKIRIKDILMPLVNEMTIYKNKNAEILHNFLWVCLYLLNLDWDDKI